MATLRDFFQIAKGMTTVDYFAALDLSVPANKDAVTNLLSSILLDPSFYEEVKEVYDSKKITDPWLSGALGFILFAVNAEKFSILAEDAAECPRPDEAEGAAQGKDKRKAKGKKTRANKAGPADEAAKMMAKPLRDLLDAANQYLREADVIQFIQREYEVGNYIDGRTRLHKVGTTSYILLNGANHVLKILKYKYVNNTVINASTRSYRDDYPSYAPHVPIVFDSRNRFIYMFYVQGCTLREYMRAIEHDKKGKITEKALGEIKDIFLSLCLTLQSYAEHGINHFDLSPSNIIIQRDPAGKPVPWLIDFGINFLFIEKVGRSTEFVSSQHYFAPELRNGYKNGSIKSDIFSLGIMLVEILSGHQLGDKDLSFCLDSVWKEYTDIAILAEQMIDRNPKNRLFEHESNSHIYDIVKERIDDEFTIYKEYKFGEGIASRLFFNAITKVLSGPIDRIKEIRRKLKTIKGLSIDNPDIVRLFRWSLVTEALHSFILALVILLALHDFGLLPKVLKFLGADSGFLDALQSLIPKNSTQFWPSKVVGFTFSIVAAKYYIDIFGLISARGVSRIVDLIMRLMAWSYAVPILWGLAYRPADWPFCAAAGVALVVVNNLACFLLAKKAKRTIDKTLELPSSNATQAFLDDFGNWWYGMLLYGVALVAIGFLINSGIAKDGNIYALAVALLGNVAFLYSLPCTKKANSTRSGLERLYSGMRRSKMIMAREGEIGAGKTAA